MIFRVFKFGLGILCILFILVIFQKESRDVLFQKIEKIKSDFGIIQEPKFRLDEVNLFEKVIDYESKPLIIKPQGDTSFTYTLVSEKIFEQTNKHRIKNGLPALMYNSLLAKAALNKVNDMFLFQYFDHVSPQGKTPSMFVQAAGYDFLTTGENLALGVFESEEALVEAWMDSPGHRANILGKQFSQIGVAVVKGVFKGDTVYMAVQEFGKPSSVCPSVSESEKQVINDANKTIQNFAIEIKQIKDEIKNSKDQEKITMYNNLVGEYNLLLQNMEERVSIYNKKVEIFNTCIETETSG